MEKQRTIQNSAQVSGIALHTGARATLKILPAPENHGIVFRRVDLSGAPTVQALATKVVDVRRGTTIAEGKTAVFTIEHIMSALHANLIDNCIVEMDGMEPPILDGSALEYDSMVKSVGPIEQDAEAKYFEVKDILHIKNEDTQIVLTPYDGFRVACTASFAGSPIDPQYYSLDVTAQSFSDCIKGARTFVNYADLKQLIAMNLVKGGSLDAAAIISDGAIICKEELRYPNEIVRHKILDLIGDLYLCGRRVKANVIAIKPGHPRNVEMATIMYNIINQI